MVSRWSADHLPTSFLQCSLFTITNWQGLLLLLQHFSVARLSEPFTGAGEVPFSADIANKLMSPVSENDIEIKPEGTVLPTVCCTMEFNIFLRILEQ